jgi:hypothetical protein
MTPVERELHRAAVKNKKERLSGIHNEVCLGCGCDLARGKEDDHMIGRKHGDLVCHYASPEDKGTREMGRRRPRRPPQARPSPLGPVRAWPSPEDPWRPQRATNA